VRSPNAKEMEKKMTKITKILAAIDFSDYSAQTVKYAGDLAEKLNAELIVANIINQRDVEAIRKIATLTNLVSESEEEYWKKQKKERFGLTQKLIEETSCTHLSVKKIISIGVPFLELIKIVKEEGVDLVVMGVKGRSNIVNVLFGSTAEKMFGHCPVPILSIRHRTHK
jgi:nucleotide-binding universal stress UspA family protein